MLDSVRLVRLGALGLFVLFAAPPLACDGEAGDGNGGSGGDPSPQDTSRCKDACNQLKFFDCNDAADHARCFEACESAPPAAIEVFVACVEADICDPACAGNLADQADPAEGGGEVEGGAEEGGTETLTCPAACSEFIADGCAPPVDCNGLCATLSDFEQSFVVYCVERRMGCTLPEECAEALPDTGDGEEGGVTAGEGSGTDPDPIEACQDACDDMEFFGCIDATQHADCRAHCTSASTDSIDTFVACAFGCTDDTCWQVFGGG